MRYKICAVTTTRADYGILCPLLKRISKDNDFELSIVAGGTHLSDKFGHTIDNVIDDGFGKIIELDYLTEETTASGVCESAGKALSLFSKHLEGCQYDAVIILGDRYEMLAIAEAAFIHRIPIIHLHGGEVTEGALDDNIRHAISKLSTIHFVANETYRNRVIQMGESPEYVINAGTLGIEVINHMKYLSRKEISDVLGIRKESPYILMTYHPETNNNMSALEEIKIVIEAISNLSQFEYIITKANADEGGNAINAFLEESAKNYKNIHLYDSLGSLRYLSAMKYADAVIGNSSSGIIEAPALQVPTINIGNRQKGRLRAESVIDVPLDAEDIKNAIWYVTDKGKKYFNYNNPYGDGETSLEICNKLKMHLENGSLRKKGFFDVYS